MDEENKTTLSFDNLNFVVPELLDSSMSKSPFENFPFMCGESIYFELRFDIVVPFPSNSIISEPFLNGGNNS